MPVQRASDEVFEGMQDIEIVQKDDCIFCKIARGEIPAKFVEKRCNKYYKTFHDINPQAPVHLVVIPSYHFDDASDIADANDCDRVSSYPFGNLMATAALAAQDLGLKDEGYRLVINSGKNAGQQVNHVHVHVLGGETLKGI